MSLFELPNHQTSLPPLAPSAKMDPLNSTALCVHDGFLLVGEHSGRVSIFSSLPYSLVSSLLFHRSPITCLAIDPLDRLWVCDKSGGVSCWSWRDVVGCVDVGGRTNLKEMKGTIHTTPALNYTLDGMCLTSAAATDRRLWGVVGGTDKVLALHLPSPSSTSSYPITSPPPNIFTVPNPIGIASTTTEWPKNTFNKTPDEIWVSGADGGVYIYSSGARVHLGDRVDRVEAMPTLSIDSTTELATSRCAMQAALKAEMSPDERYMCYVVQGGGSGGVSAKGEKRGINNDKRDSHNNSMGNTALLSSPISLWRLDTLPLPHIPSSQYNSFYHEHGLLWRLVAPGRLALYRKGGILVKQFVLINERGHRIAVAGLCARGNHIAVYSKHHIYILRVQGGGCKVDGYEEERLMEVLRDVKLKETVLVLYSKTPLTNVTMSSVGEIYEIWAMCYDMLVVWRFKDMKRYCESLGTDFNYNWSYSIPALYNIVERNNGCSGHGISGTGRAIGDIREYISPPRARQSQQNAALEQYQPQKTYQSTTTTTKTSTTTTELAKRLVNEGKVLTTSDLLLSSTRHKLSNLDLAFSKAYAASFTPWGKAGDAPGGLREDEVMRIQRIPSPLISTPPTKVALAAQAVERARSVGRQSTEDKLLALERIRRDIRSATAANFGLTSIPPNIQLSNPLKTPAATAPLGGNNHLGLFGQGGSGVQQQGAIPSLDIIDYDSDDAE